MRKRSLAWAFVAIVLLGVCTGCGKPWGARDSLFQRIVQAAGSERASRGRILGMPHSKVSGIRALAPGREFSAAYLEVKAEVHRGHAANPDDPDWMHGKGLTQLLEGSAAEAVASLQAARDLGAKSSRLACDLGSALTLLAESRERPIDLTAALDELEECVSLNHEIPAAWHERAIVHAALHQYESALEDLAEVHRLEKDPNWLREAGVLEESVLSARRRLYDSASVGSAERRFEETLTKGLQDAGPVADELMKEHQDPWLTHAMASSARAPRESLMALAKMASVRGRSAIEEYRAIAPELERLERVPLPPTLAIWRDYEILYYRARTRGVVNCPDPARPIQMSSRYPWFAAQLRLEASICEAARQRFDEAERLIDEAERIAHEAHFSLTMIRIPNFRGNRQVDTGRHKEAIVAATDALRRMSAGGFPPRRAYDFHNIVLRVSEGLHRLPAAYSAAREMREISHRSGLRTYEVVSLVKMATLATQLGRPMAEKHFVDALALRDLLKTNPDAETYFRTAEAGILEARGDLTGLRRLYEEVGAARHNPFFDGSLTNGLGRMELARGSPSAAKLLLEPFAERLRKESGARPVARRLVEDAMRTIVRCDLADSRGETAREEWETFLQTEQRNLNGPEPMTETPTVRVATIADLGAKIAVWTGRGGEAAMTDAKVKAAMVRRLRRLCADPRTPVASIERLTAELRSGLFRDATQIRYVRARGIWSNLPLSLLFRSAAFLPVTRHDVVRLQRGNERGLLVSVASGWDSETAAGAMPLPDVEKEAKHVLSLAGQGVDWLNGNGATVSEIRRRVRRDAAFFHFAGHAIRWRDRVGLLVHPDQESGVEAERHGIYLLDGIREWRPRLAVFSACSTGVFDESDTVAPEQLAHAALLGGAVEALASLWNVDSAATAMWMKEFYSAKMRGERTPLAAAQASDAIRRTPGWEHPYYWAAFVVFTSEYSRDE